MLPGQTSLKTIRDAQRARSLGLNAQQRQHLSSAAAGARSATSPAGSKLAARPRAHGKGAPVWKGVQSVAARKAMEEEVLEGRGLAEEEVGLGGADSKAEAASEEEEEGSRVPEKGAVEVPLQELAVRPARGRHISGDFELIRHVKGVIALDAKEEFGASSCAELGAGLAEEEEDEWELLGLEDEEEGAVGKEVKPQGKSWASIVGRS